MDMKKMLSLTIVLALCLSLVIPAFAAGTAVRSAQKLTVDGVPVDCEVYNIDGYNYFKLRDIAMLLNGTGSQFEVSFDPASKLVSVTTGEAYTPVGGELVVGADKSATAVPSRQTVQIDGSTVDGLSAYNIGGNNFFKLRDLGDALGFGVDFDEATSTMVVTSEPAGGGTVYVLTKEVEKVDGEVDSTTVYSDFDEYGNYRKSSFTGAEGTLESTYTYQYDAKGNVICQERANSSGSSNTTTFEYDAKGNVVKVTYVNGEISIVTVNEYDDNDNLIRSTTDSEGGLEVSTFEYDDYGSPVKTIVVSDEYSYTETEVYEYDKDGNILRSSGKLEGLTDDPVFYDESFTYDENGNLIKVTGTATYMGQASEFSIEYEYAAIQVAN